MIDARMLQQSCGAVAWWVVFALGSATAVAQSPATDAAAVSVAGPVMVPETGGRPAGGGPAVGQYDADGSTSAPSLHWSPQTKKALVRMVGGLSFVLAIFWAMIWMMRMRRAAASGPVGVLKDLGRISLSAECHLHLIQLGRRVLLLGISGDNVQTLAEVTDADEMAELLDVCGAETRRAGTAASQAVAPRHNQIRPGAIRSAVRAWTAAVRAPRRAYFEA